EILEQGLPNVVGEQFVSDGDNIFILNNNFCPRQTSDQLAILTNGRCVDVGGLEENTTLATLRQADVNVEGLSREVAAGNLQAQFVNPLRRTTGRRNEEIDIPTLTNVECSGRL